MLRMMIPHLLTPSLLLGHITWAVAIFIIPSWLIMSQWHLDPRPTCWIGSGGNQSGGGGACMGVDGRHFLRLAVPSGVSIGDGSVRGGHMVVWWRGGSSWEEALQRCCCWGCSPRSLPLPSPLLILLQEPLVVTVTFLHLSWPFKARGEVEAKSLIPWGFARIAWRFILRAGTAVATVTGAARRAPNKRYVLDRIDRFWEGGFITRKFGEQDRRIRKKMCKRRLDPHEFYHPVVIYLILIYKCV